MMTGCRQSPGSTCPRRGMGRLWRGMGGRRPPRRQHGLLGFHQPRDTQHVFPLPSGDSKESNPKPDQQVFTKHETRNTNHGLYAFVAAFLRVVERHGAAMARHGRRQPPAPAARPVGFSPATNHATCFSPALRGLQGEQPQARPTGFSRITNHETRNTAFMLFYPRFPTISRHFPVLGPPPPDQGSARCPPFAAVPVALRPQPAFLTTWRGEVGERAVRTRREPLGARRRT